MSSEHQEQGVDDEDDGEMSELQKSIDQELDRSVHQTEWKHFIADWANPLIPADSKVANSFANHVFGGYRYNGTRSDCFPNNPVTVPKTITRGDAPFTGVGDIDWSGKLLKVPPPSPSVEIHATPAPGLLTIQERKHLNIPIHQQGFYIS